MDAQLTLSDWIGARARDPSTSHEAAERVERSGQRQRQLEWFEHAVRLAPGHNSAWYAWRLGLDRHAGGRRISDLVRDGQCHYGERVSEWVDGREVPGMSVWLVK